MQQDNLLQTIQDLKTALRERLLDFYEQHEEIINQCYGETHGFGYSCLPDHNFILCALLAVAPEQAQQAMKFHEVYVWPLAKRSGSSIQDRIEHAINYWNLYFLVNDALEQRRKKRQEMQEKNERDWKL